MASKGFTNVTLAEKMRVTKQAVGQMVKAESLTTATLEKIAVALEVPVWHLIVSPEEVTASVDSAPSGDDFASYVRYHGIHYTADTLDEFFKQVDELRAITRR